MIVLGINYACEWVQIIGDASTTLTCPMKEEYGELYFKYKNQWWPVSEYASESLKDSNFDGLGKKEWDANR